MARAMAIRAREKGMQGVEGLFWASERGEQPAVVADGPATAPQQPAATAREKAKGFNPATWLTPFWMGNTFGKGLETNR